MLTAPRGKGHTVSDHRKMTEKTLEIILQSDNDEDEVQRGAESDDQTDERGFERGRI